LGDTIKNFAAIYFDFNTPVITNTAITQVVLPTGIESPGTGTATGTLVLYPNPAHSILTIETGFLPASDGRLIISDVSGRILVSKTITGKAKEHKIDISAFSTGIYFVQFLAGDRISRGKFVKD
jgi:hypothetical protein